MPGSRFRRRAIFAAGGGIAYGDIVVFAGQSNAVASGTSGGVVPAGIDALGAEVQIWNWSGHAFTEYVPGTNSQNDNSSPATPQLWGPEGEFARRWVSDNPGRTLFVVKRAQGGSQLASGGGDDWNVGSTGELFDDLTAEIVLARAAIQAAGLIPRVIAINLMQGETDALDATKAAAYEANLASFAGAALSEWADAATVLVIGRISASAEWTYGSTVRKAQAAVANDLNRVKVISTDDIELAGDNQHYTVAGITDLGGRYYDAYLGRYAVVTLGAMVSAVDTVDRTVYTFSVAAGPEAARRHLTVFVGHRGAGGAAPNSVTIDGIAASLIPGAQSGTGSRSFAYIAHVPTGTTVEIVVTFPVSTGRCGIGVLPMYGASNGDPADLGIATVDPASDTLVVPIGGVIAGYVFAVHGSAVTFSWTGAVEAFDQVVETTACHSGAAAEVHAGGNVAISVDMSLTPSVSVDAIFLAFGP